MTTSSIPQEAHFGGVPSHGARRRIVIVAAGLVLTVAGVAVTVQSNDSTISDVAEHTEVPRSALLDGSAFTAAIDATLANINVPRSALLDGPAFTAAIDAAVAVATD